MVDPDVLNAAVHSFTNAAFMKEQGADKVFSTLAASLDGFRPWSQTEVRLQNYSFSVTTPSAAKAFPDIGQTLGKAVRSSFLCLSNSKEKQKTRTVYAMRDVSSVFYPGKAYLVLGPPRSGKSTLLKAVAGSKA